MPPFSKLAVFMLSFLVVWKLLEGRDHILVIFGILKQYHFVYNNYPQILDELTQEIGAGMFTHVIKYIGKY